MIKGYNKMRLPDENKTHELIVEVNWNPKDESSNECKKVRITLAGKTIVVKKEHLHSILFAIGNEKEMRDLTPQVKRLARWYETTISVKAKKDIRAGEEIVFPIRLSLPTVEEEVIGTMEKDFIKRGKLK